MKKFTKENWKYILIYFILLFYSLSLNFISKDVKPNYIYLLLFGTILVSLIYFFILRKVDFEKTQISKIFLIIAIPIGFLYIIAFPISTIPDETAHFCRSYEISCGYLVSEKDINGVGGRDLPKSIPDIMFNSNTDNLAQYYKNVFKVSNSEETTYIGFSNTSLYSFVCYLPQAIGIFITRLFTDKLILMAYGGRIINFLVFTILIYHSLKIIPCKKTVFIIIAFLPIVFQEAISLSPDALTIAISFFLISYILNLRYVKDENYKLKLYDYAILTISIIVMSLCKIVYIPLCILLFLIPKEKYGSAKRKNIFNAVLISSAIIINLLWLVFSSRYLVEFNEGVNTPNQVKFVLGNIPTYIGIIIRTIELYLQNFIDNIVGGSISLMNIELSKVLRNITLFLLLITIFTDNAKNYKIDRNTKIVFLLVFGCIIGLIFTSLYVQWTPVESNIINGVQGRYFIPIILLIPFICNNSYFVFNPKKSFRTILMFMVLFNLHAISKVILFYS